MALRNVVLAGVTGNLGPALLTALSSSPSLTVTVDYTSIDNLTTALQGQDAVVSAIPPTAAASQTNLIHAAVAAKVTRFLPSEFGSDLDNPLNRAAPVYGPKIAAQELLKSLAAAGKISYTIVYNGAFLDWGLKIGFPLSPVLKKAALHDGGDRLYSTTTLPVVGQAVVGVLAHLEETKNRVVRVSEATTTLKELLALSQEIVGSEGWSITEPDTTAEVDKALAQMKQGVINQATIMPFIFKAIWGEGNGGLFEKTDNELLGIRVLDREGIKRVIQGVVDGH
ncbi:hypothetical protein BJX70DRAFT_236779 [Aspergillus crustosus]